VLKSNRIKGGQKYSKITHTEFILGYSNLKGYKYCQKFSTAFIIYECLGSVAPDPADTATAIQLICGAPYLIPDLVQIPER